MSLDFDPGLGAVVSSLLGQRECVGAMHLALARGTNLLRRVRLRVEALMRKEDDLTA